MHQHVVDPVVAVLPRVSIWLTLTEVDPVGGSVVDPLHLSSPYRLSVIQGRDLCLTVC